MDTDMDAGTALVLAGVVTVVALAAFAVFGTVIVLSSVGILTILGIVGAFHQKPEAPD